MTAVTLGDYQAAIPSPTADVAGAPGGSRRRSITAVDLAAELASSRVMGVVVDDTRRRRGHGSSR